MKKILVVSLLASAAGAACAQAYVGAGVGFTQYGLDCTGADSCDKSSSGGKVFGGYAFTPAVAAEVGYLNFGTTKVSVFYLGYLVNMDFKPTALTAAVALRGTLSPTLSGVARLGLAQTKVTVSGRIGSFTAPDDSETSTKAYFGLGLEYAFTKNFKGTLSADFTQGTYAKESDPLRLIGVGAQYNF